MDIQIITDERRDVSARYQLGQLVARWQGLGHRILVGPAASLTGDVCFLHIDTTVIPPSQIPSNPDHRPFVNGGVLDISKRRISSAILTADSSYKGQVVLKTDANSFGGAGLAAASRWHPARMRRRMASWIGWRLARALPKRTYLVLDSLNEVPRWVWGNNDLVVEKFQPERDGALYVVRSWRFVGKQGYTVRCLGPDPIVKGRSLIRTEYLDEGEPEQKLWAWRRYWGMNFGKIDYVLVEGNPVVLDISTTPAFPPRHDARLDCLVEGLASLKDCSHLPNANAFPG